MPPSRSGFLCILLITSLYVSAQDIPTPSGKFGIGHHRFEWADKSRPEILGENNKPREIVVDIWYPSDRSSGVAVPYLDTAAITQSGGLQSLLGGPAANRVRSTGIHTHAYENTPFTSSLKSAPVLFFSHGMGMISQLYTGQIEDLASHGYVVVAIQHTYDAWLTSFSDGRQMAFEKKQRNAAGNTEEQHIAYENKRIEWWAEDIRFAYDQLAILNRSKDSTIRIAGFLDLNRVGALGHSSGGRAAARACQLDPRIKSCADQDGVAMMQPFYIQKNGIGMKQPFLLFERVQYRPPTEADIASMGMSLQEVKDLVARLRKQKEDALKSTGESFHVLLKFDSSNHMSFSDLPLLNAKTEAELNLAYKLLQTTCNYTREFFDKTLRGVSAPLYDRPKKLNYIEVVEHYKNLRDRK